MKTSLKKSLRFSLLLLAASVLLVVLAEFLQTRAHSRPEMQALHAEKLLRQLEEKMIQSLDRVAEINNDSAFHQYFIHRGFQQLGFSFYYVENEVITKWSDNEIEISSKVADTCKTNSLIHLNNGWYELFIHKQNEKEIIGLILIRKEYAYENQYLVNGFNPELQLPADGELAAINAPNSFVIRAMNDEPLFAVRFLPMPGASSGFDSRSWLYLISFLFFLVAVFAAAKALSGISSLFSILLVTGIATARIWMIQLHIPDEFYTTAFFSPQLYASSFYFNSLGDLFINAMLIFCFSGIFYSVVGKKNFYHRNKMSTNLVITGSLTLLFFISLALDNLVRGIVLNSRISFDTGNIFSMNEYSLSGIVVVAALLASYFLVTIGVIHFFSSATDKKTFTALTFSALIIFGITYCLTASGESSFWFSPLIFAFAVAILAVFLIIKKKNENKIRLNFLLGITLLFTAYVSIVIWNMNGKKEKENRKLLAQKIETGQDQAAEYLFAEVGTKIRSDEIVRRLFKDTLHVQELVSKRLMQFYFTGYWSRFNISLYCIDPKGMPFDTMQAKLPFDTLKKEIKDELNADAMLNIQYVGGTSGQQHYAAVIPVLQDNTAGSVIGYIAVVLAPKLFQTAEGFPELFVSNKVAFNKELTNYSYARYKNDSLLNQSGDFAYYFSIRPFQPSQPEYSFIDVDGYNHLVHRVNDSSYIIVSKSRENMLVLLTLFSYLLCMFCFLLLTGFVIWRLVTNGFRLHLSLNSRIQVSVVMLVILSFVLTGSGTMYYIFHKYDLNKDKSIHEKTSTLLTALEKELGDAVSLKSKLSDEAQASLIRLSGMVNADFNLYTLHGNLYYSSQPKIFEQGILSRKINPDALFELSEKGKTQFVHPESIGSLNYISAYEPLRNHLGKRIGYLHLPYFEKQNELNKEISSFLSALINIYVLLFALAVLVTFFISIRITHPLQLIQENLSNIRLGRKNELIEYRQQDEIGELVNEYNRMIEELAASAEKLARSERESAWREMAKQVAHEIKNPLTPMKLSLQHLQRAWDEKSPELNTIFHRISQTLVQQIDTLSTIATEFSHFAQMPQAKKETVNLVNVLEVSMDLYKEEPNINFVFTDDQKEKVVIADKDQLIRVFSNLFKNAIQSIPDGKQGVIHVGISTITTDYRISIQDNGAGISPERKERMFTPSFTTKSGGMGLGLSIVKSIVENSGGSIWYETEEQRGTTFYISLPMANLSNL